jgi:hypothetical protein
MSEPKPTPITGALLGEAPPPDDNEVFGNPRSFPMLWKKTKSPVAPRTVEVNFPGKTPTNNQIPEG